MKRVLSPKSIEQNAVKIRYFNELFLSSKQYRVRFYWVFFYPIDL